MRQGREKRASWSIAHVNPIFGLAGKVITALVKKDKYVPYRDSKLTRLLQSSLGGNAFTVMLACVSPDPEQLKVSLSTFRFADSAKKIVNTPVVNVDAEKQKLRELMQRIADLEDTNQQLRSDVGDLTAEVDSLRGKPRSKHAAVGPDHEGATPCCVIC